MARRNIRGFGARSRRGDPYAETANNGAPVDIAAVRRDDELIDAIASDRPVATDSPDEQPMVDLLTNWRTEIITPPLPAAPDIDRVFAVVNEEIGARRVPVAAARLRLLRPIAGAAAAVALLVGGVMTLSYDATPGDPLWTVKQVAFSQQANSTVANIDTTTDLNDAERYIAAGNPQEAQIHLDQASTRAVDVDDTAQRFDLIAWRNRLQRQVNEQLPPVTQPSPSVPLPFLPSLPVLPPVPSTAYLPSVVLPVQPVPPVTAPVPVPPVTAPVPVPPVTVPVPPVTVPIPVPPVTVPVPVPPVTVPVPPVTAPVPVPPVDPVPPVTVPVPPVDPVPVPVPVPPVEPVPPVPVPVVPPPGL